MKLLHNSIDLTKTDSIKTLKEQVSDSIHILLMQRDMGGFFGDFLRYVDVLDDTVKFYEFDRPGSGETDWAIMKACLVNAGDLETIVNFKYAVWREGEGWRCVSSRESGIEYLWDFFECEREDLKAYTADVLQKIYDGEELDNYAKHVIVTFLSRFEDWEQPFMKAKELRNVK
jgi:hypothetical protein